MADREYWRIYDPSGRKLDWLETSIEAAEDYMIAEALTGSAPTRAEALTAAYGVGYTIKKVSVQ